VSDFRNLLVWQKAHALALHVDRAGVAIRAARYASLRGQIIRAAMSIPANIAEGRRQDSEKEFARFLRYSVNSASELEHHLVVVRDIGAMPVAECDALVAELIEVRKMLRPSKQTHEIRGNVTREGKPLKHRKTASMKADQLSS
jgi:four helix bundle protein